MLLPMSPLLAALLLAGCPGSGTLPETEGATPTPPPGLPACEGGVQAQVALEALEAPGPDSGAYVQEDSLAIQALADGLGALVDGQIPLAIERATAAGYDLCAGSEEEADLVLARPLVPDSGKARVVWRQGDAAPLQIGVPHAVSEPGSLVIALAVFRRTKARLLVVSGTHRCAALAESFCTGTTAACGEDAPHRISDAAHWDRAVFHRAAVLLAASFPEDSVASVHTMTTHEGISVSDGTWGSLDPAADPPPAAAAVWAALVEAFPQVYVSTCNGGLGVPPDLRLCGTTNLQGRGVNGVPDADVCLVAASWSTGRFVHVEVESDIAKASAEGIASAWCAALPGCG